MMTGKELSFHDGLPFQQRSKVLAVTTVVNMSVCSSV